MGTTIQEHTRSRQAKGLLDSAGGLPKKYRLHAAA